MNCGVWLATLPGQSSQDAHQRLYDQGPIPSRTLYKGQNNPRRCIAILRSRVEFESSHSVVYQSSEITPYVCYRTEDTPAEVASSHGRSMLWPAETAKAWN